MAMEKRHLEILERLDRIEAALVALGKKPDMAMSEYVVGAKPAPTPTPGVTPAAKGKQK
jgi:hypothetical protein